MSNSRGTASRRRGYGRFVARRLGASLLTLLGITIVAFVLTTLVPARPETANLGQRALSDPVLVQQYRDKYGLDDPLPLQYVAYLGNLAQGDLGTSQQTLHPVLDDLREFAPATLELVLTATVMALGLGLLLGVAAAVKRGTWVDKFARISSLAGVSLPIFWLALVASIVFFRQLHLLPGSGRLDPSLVPPPRVTGFMTLDALFAGAPKTFFSAVSHLILPASVLAISTVGMILRFTRSSVLEALSSDFVKAARAKGLRQRTVLWRYALRAAAGPLVTATTLSFGFMLAATVYVEQLFAWPGLGQYAYRSSTNLDLAAVMGVSIAIAGLFVLMNLVADLLYAYFDPRIRLQ